MSYPWWATALIAAGTFLAGVKIGRIERAEERALDEADDLAGLAAAVGYNLEADDHPTPAPATVACRRGEWIEKAAAWAAARLVGVAAWWDELRAAWGVDRSPTWQPGEIAAMKDTAGRHAAEGVSTQAEDYQPRHAAETISARRPALSDHSPLSLAVRKRLAPAAFALRRQQLVARAAIRRALRAMAAQQAERRAA